MDQAVKHGVLVDPDYQLQDNLQRKSGRIFITGTQALVRLLIDQKDADAARGLDTAGFISGYRGSPLGAVDQEAWRAARLLEANGIEFLPAINEDLAASAVLGTQQVEADPARKVTGVFAMWYGKGPGVNRSGDALKHGNAYGSSPHGGVLVVLGDDHGCVSSSMPHQSEQALMAWSMPVVNPSNIEEYLEFGPYGWALSRFSGTWVGFKAISETVEGGAVVEIPAPRTYIDPPGYVAPAGGLHIRWPDLPGLGLELRVAAKLDAVQAFAKHNSIDRMVVPAPGAKLGIISAGKAYLDLLEALARMGIGLARLEELGVRLYKPGLTFPLEKTRIAEFSAGLQEVLVVEEKGPVIEDQLKTLLYNQPEGSRPRLLGKTDADGGALLSALGELRPSRIAPSLIRWLAPHHPALGLEQYRPRVLRRGPAVERRRRRQAHAAFLLRLPAQYIDPCARRQPRAGRHRLPLHGDVDGPQHGQPDADGRRGSALGRRVALHQREARFPESRRRHLLSLRPAGDPPGHRRAHQHHLQDTVQR